MEGKRTFELFNLGGFVVDVNTLDIALHFTHEKPGNSTFRFRALSYCQIRKG